MFDVFTEQIEVLIKDGISNVIYGQYTFQQLLDYSLECASLLSVKASRRLVETGLRGRMGERHHL
jgi:hypothetical protein